VCDPASATTTRLTPAEQVKVGTAYVSGFFRLTLGGEKQFQPMFDGSDVTVPSTSSFAHISVTATQPAKSRVDLDTFEHPDSAVSASGGAGADVCADMGGTGGVDLPQTLPYCSTSLNEAAVPHWSPAQWAWNVPSSPMLHMTWSSATGQVRVGVPKADRDLSGYQQISVKMAADEKVATGTDLTISLVDGAGRTWSSPVSKLNPQAVDRMPGVSSPWLRKVILQQVTIPASALGRIDTRDVREVRFTAGKGADGTYSGGVYLSDLSAEDRSVGKPAVTRQAAVNLVAAHVDEGSGPGMAEVAAVLSKPVSHPVTAYVSAFGVTGAKAGEAVHKVTFAPGRTCVALPVPTYGDTLPSTTPATSFKISATDVSGAVMGDKGFSTLTVREDDGVTGGTPAAEVGVPGDPCTEYAASLRTGTLHVKGSVASGSRIAVSASGYRAGESVDVTLGSADLGRTVADRHGTVSPTVVVPAGTPPGKAVLSAVGAGSSHHTEADVQVRK
jgi:hypothetical protein